jgi:predicted DNA-binding transcriptional regulator AlpA
VNDALVLADVLRVLEAIRDTLRDHSRPPAELLTRDDMPALLNVGLSTFDRLRAAGKIGPRPLELGGLKWDRNEVLAWLRHRDQAGELLDAKSWPPVWQALQPKSKTR